MPTRKIRDAQIPCRHPEHNPPNMRVYEPGSYEHECPSCHRKVQFEVPAVFWSTTPTKPFLPRSPSRKWIRCASM